MEHDIEKAQNLKLILSAFEQLSGLKINFHKIELFCFGEALDEVNTYTDLFGCGQGQFFYEVFGDSNSLSETYTCRMETSRGKTTEVP
jgi:hypothetical protein